MPERTEPTLAVVIAARDASRYIGLTLESLVDQSRLPEQVVVYDDGSEDNTAEIARGMAEDFPHLFVIEGRESVGISAARNRANGAADTDYIAVLDSDDLFGYETVRRYVGYLYENPETDLLYADTRVFGDDMERGKARRYPTFRTHREAIRKTLGSPLIPFKHSSMVYRRSAFEKVGGYDESLPIKVDVDLFLRFHASGLNVSKLDRTTSYHRKHDRQMSRNRIRGIRAYQRLIRTYEPDRLVRGILLSTRIPSELLKLLVRG